MTLPSEAQPFQVTAAGLPRDLHGLGRLLVEREAEIAELKRERDALLSSASWRVTRPLRFAGRTGRLLALGVSAWAGLRPGSRPRRLLGRALRRVRRPPEVQLPEVDRTLPAPEPSTQSVPDAAEAKVFDFGTEPESVRLAYKRAEAARHNISRLAQAEPPSSPKQLPRLAFVTPMPPVRSGIADYSVEILSELALFYDVDVVVTQANLASMGHQTSWTALSVDAFEARAHTYDRILYQIGNSEFHHHMFLLLEKFPGVVVLHDFYLSHIIGLLEMSGGWDKYWTHALMVSHGYEAVKQRYEPFETENALWQYPCNLRIVQEAQGIIVHSEFSRRLAKRFYGEHFADDWAVVPMARRLPSPAGRSAARRDLGLNEDQILVCSFGQLQDNKLNHRLLKAWLASRSAGDSRSRLVFVGETPPSDYCDALRATIEASAVADRIHITGFASPELYRQYLQAADMAVQLRTMSRGETSAALFDCMGQGLATVVNAHGPMASCPAGTVSMLPDDFTDEALTQAIDALRFDGDLRSRIGERARAFVRDELAPSHVASAYHAAIERFATTASAACDVRRIAEAVAERMPELEDDGALLRFARDFARRNPLERPYRQFLVDVSALARGDLKTGIQRVVRAQVSALLAEPPPGFRVEPVWLWETDGATRYHYARCYTARLFGIPEEAIDDDPVEVSRGDVFFGADYFAYGVTQATGNGLFAAWRESGVHIGFLVYDILPLTFPHFFPDFAEDVHGDWLSAIADVSDELICISQAVADDVRRWLQDRKPEALERLRLHAVHLGADIDASAPTTGLPAGADRTLEAITSRPTFLMVGTVEPRKGYLQAISAFDILWRKGSDVCLLIVGGEGWKPLPEHQRRTIPEIVDRLLLHPEAGERLFWLQGVSDEYLQRVYDASVCLIAASEDEGFGLPLIEAAHHGLPILARDIPVFREVAGTHASYFSGMEPNNLAEVVERWLEARAAGHHQASGSMPWLTWADNVDRVKAALLGS